MSTTTIALLEKVRDALKTITGVTTCKIGLEDAITAADYPIIRIVPSRMDAGVRTIDGTLLTRKIEVLIYFGLPVQPFDDVADAGSRTRLEKVYAALLALESSIIAKLLAPISGVLSVEVRETITDEDRLDTYKIMAVRAEIEG